MLFELILDPTTHARRVVLQGRGHSIEVRSEWGLAHFDLDPVNLQRPMGERSVRGGEILVDDCYRSAIGHGERSLVYRRFCVA